MITGRYNVKIKESIANWQQNNENPAIDQPSLILILKEASKTFPEEKPSKNDWFSKDEKNLLKLVSERNENERKLRLNKNTEHFKLACKNSRKALKKAIKNAKENWMKEEISKLQGISVDPFTAWQANKRLQKSLSHHHSNSKDKYTKVKKSNRTLTDKPKEQVKIQSDFFGKEIFGRNAPYDNDAI